MKPGAGTEGTTTRFLNAYDPDSANLTFTISGLIHGSFKQVNSSNEFINQFSLLDILAQTILFAHDGSDFAPAYNVTLSDGLFATDSMPANITFSAWPETEYSSAAYQPSFNSESSATVSVISSSSETTATSDSRIISSGITIHHLNFHTRSAYENSDGE